MFFHIEGDFMTVGELVTKGIKELESAGVPEAQINAMYLLEYTMHISQMDYLLDRQRAVTNKEEEDYLSAIATRKNRVPLQHITGEQEFMGYTFLVNEHVLIPRQDTEILVEEAAKLAKGKRILDMCTGSGCIILSMEQLCKPKYAMGVDVSAEALSVAKANGKHMDSKVHWLQSDLFDKVTKKFDVIVSNPPYIERQEIPKLMEEVRCYEPNLALDGGEDGLDFYRRIITESREHMESEGYLCFEIGYNQGKAVSLLMKEAGFGKCQVIKDLAGLDRVVIGQLLNKM